uniref:Putative soluble epoxide hydrolase n=1 Tax=Xenopsylla cheopis TaxID=163159 RepID=A0A6M2DGN9_XENCH
MAEVKRVLVILSPWRQMGIYFLAILLGIWLCMKRTAQCIWTSSKPLEDARDSPPPCLVETNGGRHSYVKLKGTKLHYVEIGSKDKPLLLLLHGFPDCWIGWRHQMSEFSQHFRVVALDLKGFGDSDKPVWRHCYRPTRVLGELDALVSALGARSCTIVGHDLGAQLGWFLIHAYPDLVDKFVAISAPHPNLHWDTIPGGAVFDGNWLKVVQLPMLAERDAMRYDLQVLERCYSHLLSGDNKEKNLLEAYKYVFSRSSDWAGPMNYFRNLPYYRVRNDVSTIQVPVLLITGNRDPFCRLESVVQSSDWCDNSLVKIVEGAGHWPHQEFPEAFNRLLMPFLVRQKSNIPMPERTSSKGLMGRMLGAVSQTVKYGGSVIDTVQKKTNGAVGVLHQLT